MATDNLIARLYESPKTILTVKDIALIWEETNTANLLTKIKYYAKQGIANPLDPWRVRQEQRLRCQRAGNEHLYTFVHYEVKVYIGISMLIGKKDYLLRASWQH